MFDLQYNMYLLTTLLDNHTLDTTYIFIIADHCHCCSCGVLVIYWKSSLSLDASGTQFFILCGNADHLYNVVH